MSMQSRWIGRALVLSLSASCTSPALAQDEPVASLPWTFGQTAGQRGQVYDGLFPERDRWMVEDFSLAQAAELTTFETIGRIHPSSTADAFRGLSVVILDALPPDGQVVLESVADEGTFVSTGLSGTFETTFGGQLLPAGDYVIMWAARVPTTDAIALFWHPPGDHAVGGGLPDNGYAWVPFTMELTELPLMLGGGGRTGANFILSGIPVSCRADIDGDGDLTIFDFLAYQNLFDAGDPAADFDGDGELTIFDFLAFQNEFDAGC